MKVLFSFVFLFFLSFQTQARNLIEHSIRWNNMSEFDWEAFSNKENIQNHIDNRNEIFDSSGKSPIIFGLDKIHLVRIEQELELYKRDIKKDLSSETIQKTEQTIAFYWEYLNRMENQIKTHAGLIGLASLADSVDTMTIKEANKKKYYNGTWELYTQDYEIVFDMLEKKDQALYEDLGSNDEAYTEFIAPYVERYLQKMRETAQAYYNSLGGEVDYKIPLKSYNNGTIFRVYLKKETTFKDFNVTKLIDMYENSLELYNSFIKNFTKSTGEYHIQAHQKKLMRVIEGWYMEQSSLAAKARIEAYTTYGIDIRPNTITYGLGYFYDAPLEVKEEIALFLREDILNNEKFINTDDETLLRSRVNAIESLNDLNVATDEEVALYKAIKEQEMAEIHRRAKEQEILRKAKKKELNKTKEQEFSETHEERVIIKDHPYSDGDDLSFLDVSS